MADNKDNEISMPEAKTIEVDIDREMRKSFLDYSMSVIVSRALPDVRDGLKPVKRWPKACTQKNFIYNARKRT